MSSLAEMRKELRELRKEKVKPVSRMKKADIACEINKLSVHREETPAPAATPAHMPRKMASTAQNIKDAKAHQFPMQPEAAPQPKGSKTKTPAAAPEAPKPGKKSSKGVTRDMLQAMLDGLEEDD